MRKRLHDLRREGQETVPSVIGSAASKRGIQLYWNVREFLDSSLDERFIVEDVYPYDVLYHVDMPRRRDPKLAHYAKFYGEVYYINEHLAKERERYHRKGKR